MRRWDTRSVFVILQVALSMVLLTVASLFTRSLLQLAAVGPGFDATHTVIAAIHPLPGHSDGERSWDLRRQVLERVQSIPGIEAVTSTGTLPLMGEVPGEMVRPQGNLESPLRNVYVIGAGENYFRTLQVPILRGRDFTIADRGRAPIPVIVNRTLAHDFFAEADPIGERLSTGREKETVYEIVGVCEDFKMRTMGEASAPAMFKPEFNAQLLVRVVGNPASWIQPLRNALGEVDGTAALAVRPLDEAVDRRHVSHARGNRLPRLTQQPRTGAIADRVVRIGFLRGRSANPGIRNSRRAWAPRDCGSSGPRCATASPSWRAEQPLARRWRSRQFDRSSTSSRLASIRGRPLRCWESSFCYWQPALPPSGFRRGARLRLTPGLRYARNNR